MSNYQMQLSTAQQWTTSWNQRNPNMVKAFRIDRAEIEEILAITNVAYVRVYMGYDADENIEKIMLVGVDEDGKDIIDTTPNRPSNIFDFTMPCPDACDTTSPINS